MDPLAQKYEQRKHELGGMAHDLIGLTFYNANGQYKRKFITLHSHFQFDHHPLRKLLEEFKHWLETFIRDKQGKIKTSSELFQMETPEDHI